MVVRQRLCGVEELMTTVNLSFQREREREREDLFNFDSLFWRQSLSSGKMRQSRDKLHDTATKLIPGYCSTRLCHALCHGVEVAKCVRRPAGVDVAVPAVLSGRVTNLLFYFS